MTDKIVERLRDEGASALRKHLSMGMWQLCAEAADEIERLLTDCDRLREFNTKLCTEIERLQALLKECSDELADQVEGQYARTKDHPAMKRRYDRDMQPVLDARAALRGKSDD